MALTQIPIELSSTPGIVDNSNATAITIDSSENVLVGKSVTTFATEGATFEKGGALELTTDSGRALRVHRTTNDGSLIEFNKDSTTVGSIATVAGRLGIGTGDAGLFFDDDNNRIGPVTLASGTPVDSDGLLDLGYSGARYKDLYLSGGVVFGDAGGSGTSTSNSLDSYEEGTFTPDLSFGGVSAGVSWNVQAGRYTKIGNLVTVGVYLYESTGRGSGTGNATINIPFNVSSSQPDLWVAVSNRQGITAGSNKTLTIFGNANGSYLRFYAGDNSGGNNTVLNHTAFSASSGFEVSFTVTYRTDA